MTVRQLLKHLTQSNWSLLRSRQTTIEVDCDCDGRLVTQGESLLDSLSSLLRYAVESSPVGGRIAISVIATETGIEIEIADSSDLTADSAIAGSFDVARARRELQNVGTNLHILNCPQGGVAYSLALPNVARAAA